MEIEDLYHLLQNVIFSGESHGRLGGKSAGLFLASQILKNAGEGGGSEHDVPHPQDLVHLLGHDARVHALTTTWTRSSSRSTRRLKESVSNTRMSSICSSRPSSRPRWSTDCPWPWTILGRGHSIVRSSSLLEDRTGSAFVDKYKSVFLGNQGTREERLRDLMQAVAEVYASNFGPDPIEYRAESRAAGVQRADGCHDSRGGGNPDRPLFSPRLFGSRPQSQRFPVVFRDQTGGRHRPHHSRTGKPSRGQNQRRAPGGDRTRPPDPKGG